MYRWPLADGGLMVISLRFLRLQMAMKQLWDGATPRVGVWNLYGFDKPYTVLHISLHRQSLLANNSQIWAVNPWALDLTDGHHICRHEPFLLLLVLLHWTDNGEVYHRMNGGRVSLPLNHSKKENDEIFIKQKLPPWNHMVIYQTRHNRWWGIDSL